MGLAWRQLLFMLAAALGMAHSPGRSMGADRSEQITATVRAVDLERRTLDLVTGVGYALRIRRVEIPAGLMVGDRGARAPLSALRAGCIVRVGCHHGAAEMVATTLELIERPAPDSKP